MNSNLTDFHQRESYTPDYKHSIQYKTYEIKCENAEIEKERSAISKPDKLSISEMCNRGYKNEYNDIDLIASITQLECSEADKKILIGLATGEIEKKDIPVVLGWSNRNDRKKLSRYVGKLKLLLSDVI